MKTDKHIRSYLAHFFLESEKSQTKFVEKIKTRVLCSIIFFFENRAVYEFMRLNIEEPDKPQIKNMTYAH